MFRGVEVENLLALTRSRIDGAHVFATLHLPDGGNLSVLLHSVICDLFRTYRGGGSFTSLIRGVPYGRGFVFRHLKL